VGRGWGGVFFDIGGLDDGEEESAERDGKLNPTPE